MALKDGMIDGLLWKKEWRTVGPGGGGAQFYPAISPHDDKHMLEFCDMQGTYMSRDGGKNWRNMSLRSGGKCAAFDPNQPNVVYAGSTGLYRSDDYGCTWHVIMPRPCDITGEYWSGDEAMHTFSTAEGVTWQSGAIQGIALDGAGLIAIAQGYATNAHGERIGGALRVFCSQDDGETWRCTDPLPKGLLFRHILFDPAASYPRVFAFNSEALYAVDCRDMSFEEIPLPAGEGNIFSADAGIDPRTGRAMLYLFTFDEAAGIKRLYRSDNGGEAWKQLDYGIPSTRGGVPDGKALACCPTDASVIYLSVYRKTAFDAAIGNYEGVKKSTDYGETWTWSIAIDEDFPAHFTKGWMEEHYGYEWPEPPISMAVAPGKPDVCVYTTYGTSMRTDDGGQHWFPIYSDPQPDGSALGRGLEVTTCYSMHFDPHNRDNMMISYTDIGLFRSVNGGRSWLHAIDGIPHAWRNTCYDICYDPDIPGKVWGGWGVPHDIPRGKLTHNDGFRRGASRRSGGVALSADGGAHWQLSNTGIDEHAVTTCLILDPASPAGRRTLYTASWGIGVYRSDDDGQTWQYKSVGLGAEPLAWKIFLRCDGALLLCISRGIIDGQEVPGRLMISRDRAETWQPLPLPEHTSAPNDLALDPRDANTMYMAMWPYDVDGKAAHGGVYKTIDGGRSWLRMPLPCHVEYTYGITLDAANPDTLYVVDFQQNAHRTDDGGKTWRRLGGYSVKWGHKAFPDPHNPGMLYITTFGSSVFYGPADGNHEPFDDVHPVAGH